MAGKPNKPIEYAKEHTGRPSKFTPEIRAAIVDDIAHRIPYEFAAEANGICEETLYIWINRGKKDRAEGIESDYSVFLKDIKAVERNRMREHSDNIAERPERWQADAWLLERRWSKHYGPNAQINELNAKLDKLMEGEKNEDGRKERENEEEKEA